MKAILLFTIATLAMTQSPAQADDGRLYEMRRHYAAPRKLDSLHARFRDHAVKLFEKHGITNVAYLTPLDNTDNKLIYFVSYPDAEARKKSWAGFFADPAWQSARAESEK